MTVLGVADTVVNKKNKIFFFLVVMIMMDISYHREQVKRNRWLVCTACQMVKIVSFAVVDSVSLS